MKFIETFPYVIWYKKGKENVVADMLHTRLFGFEHIKVLYSKDIYFAPIVENLKQKCVVSNYMLFDGFRKTKFCILTSSTQEFLVKKPYGRFWDH